MLIIFPTLLITLLTFPGVIIHEIAHRFFCDWVGLAVYKVKYFIPSNKVSGYVLHEKTTNINHQYLISMAPFIINTLVCALLTFPTSLPSSWFGDCIESDPITQILFNIMAWVGVSSGMHAFPSTIDLDQIERVYHYYPSQSQFFCRIIESSLKFFRFFDAIRFFVLDLFYVLLIKKILPFLLL